MVGAVENGEYMLCVTAHAQQKIIVMQKCWSKSATSQDFSGEAGLFKNFNVNLQMLVTNYVKNWIQTKHICGLSAISGLEGF